VSTRRTDGLSDRALEHLRQVMDWPDLAGSRYAVEEELDRGGMGVVYRAFDRELERDVALKVLATAVADDASAERLWREARIIAGLEHPGIVPVHDVGRLPDGRVYYAMKRVSGQRLDAWVRAGAARAEKLRLFLRICEPIAFAHARGVIHRDLKPENVMVGPFGEILVLDWGVAKRIAEHVDEHVDERINEQAPRRAQRAEGERSQLGDTAQGTVVGTPLWMAPEQARGEIDRLDARTDVFGLGGVLFFLLRGRAPAVDEPRGGGVPRALDAIWRRARASEPAARYASASELAADVARFLEGHAVRALPEGLTRRTLRVASRHRAAILLVTAYVVVRVALFFGFRV
jgi:eukaryotic-like serine/threonine-protein kinase